MKNFIQNNRFLNPIAKAIYFTLIEPLKSFSGSEDYWIKRYNSGGNSGAGSYHKLAKFKSDILNDIIKNNQISTIIEYGCGDGNQVRSSKYPSYIGFDVSSIAIKNCRDIFSNDSTKTFKIMNAYANEKAELTLSLDVIYHLIEDDVFYTYMERLFNSSTKLVVIYSSDIEKQYRYQASHVKHRKFSTWVKKNKPEWEMSLHIPNIYPYSDNNTNGSFADFYIYNKV